MARVRAVAARRARSCGGSSTSTSVPSARNVRFACSRNSGGSAVEPTPTAVVVAATTWAEFPAMWGPMLDEVWSFLRGGAPAGLYEQGHNIMLYKDDVPNVEVGV